MGLLPLEKAFTIVTQALVRAREMDLEPMTVVVVDAAGVMKAMGREDGASLIRPDLAMAKAWGAVGMGFPARELARRQDLNGQLFNALHVMSGGKVVGNLGGVIILDQGVAIGAVGATGDAGANDEAIALYGVEAAGLQADFEAEPQVRHSPL